MTISYRKELELLLETASLYGIGLTHSQGELLLRHLELVCEKNKMVNLTRITDSHEAVIKHVFDSLLFLKNIPFERDESSIRFVDIGTGAGFPGIPIAVVTQWDGMLIDSVGKKVDAVSEFISELSIDNISTEHMRAEELAQNHTGEFDLVVARAVADIAVLMEYASPLLKIDGYLCVSKGKPTSEELNAAEHISKICGFEGVSRETYQLPEGCGERNVFLYQKTCEATVKLPRRVGMAAKRPLFKK